MTSQPGSRERIIRAAARLFQRQGYPGTGLKQIIEESGAPRGSLYFHFPGGKEELAVAALTDACEARFDAMFRVFRETESAAAAFRVLVEAARSELVGSGFSEGCPIATVVLEMASASDPIQGACSRAWRGWEALFEARLREDGYTPARARGLALTALALLEGSLLLSRAHRSTEPLDAAREEMSAMLTKPVNEDEDGRS